MQPRLSQVAEAKDKYRIRNGGNVAACVKTHNSQSLFCQRERTRSGNSGFASLQYLVFA